MAGWGENDKPAEADAPASGAFGVNDRPARGAIAEIANQGYAGIVSDLPKMAGQALQYASDPGRPIYNLGARISKAADERGKAPDLQPDEANHNIVTNTLAAGARMIPQSVVPAAAVGAGLALAPISPAVALGGAALLGSIPAAMSQGQQTLDKAREAGIPDEVAIPAARKTAAIEGLGETAGTYLGGKMLGVGGKAISTQVNRALGRTAGTAAENALTDATSRAVLKPFAKQLPETLIGEVGTEMGQNAGEAYVEQQAGIDKQTPWDAAKEAIAPTVGMTALLAPFGLAGHALGARRRAAQADTLAAAGADPEQRAAVVADIRRQLAEVDPQAAQNFTRNTTDAIALGQPLEIGPHLLQPPAPKGPLARAAALAPEAPNLTTSPGAKAQVGDGIDFTREVDTSGLSLEDRAAQKRARAATVDFQPADQTPAWDTAPGAAGPRTAGLDMPAREFDTTGLGIQREGGPMVQAANNAPAARAGGDVAAPAPLAQVDAPAVLTGPKALPAGEPSVESQVFKNRMGANNAARKAGPGYVVTPVDGGYVLRRDVQDVTEKPAKAPDAQAAPQPAPSAALPAPGSETPAVSPATVPAAGPAGASVNTDAALKGVPHENRPAASVAAVQPAQAADVQPASGPRSNAQRPSEGTPPSRAGAAQGQPAADRSEPAAVSRAPAAEPVVAGRGAGAAPAKPLTVGRTPNSAEPVTVKAGTVHIGKLEAVNFETGEPVTVAEGASDAQIKQALHDAGAIGKRQKFYGGREASATDAAVPQVKAPAIPATPTNPEESSAAAAQPKDVEAPVAAGPGPAKADTGAAAEASRADRLEAAGLKDRPANWRSNFLQAARVARDAGIDPKGKKLAGLVAEIEAKDGATVPDDLHPESFAGSIKSEIERREAAYNKRRTTAAKKASEAPKALAAQQDDEVFRALPDGKGSFILDSGESIMAGNGDGSPRTFKTVQEAHAWAKRNDVSIAPESPVPAPEQPAAAAKPQGGAVVAPEAAKATEAAVAEPTTAVAEPTHPPAAPAKSGETAKIEDAGADNLLDAETNLWNRITSGAASLDEFKAGFDNWMSNKDAITALLATKKKDDLLNMGGSMFAYRYKSENKPKVVEALWSDGLASYALGRGISYSMGKGSYEASLRTMVESTDADQLAQYAAERKAAQEEAVARLTKRAEGIKDPKTLDDFRQLMGFKVREQGMTVKDARLTLTPEQRAEFDNLLATASRSERKDTKDEQRAVRVAGQQVDAQIIETKHTQKGHDLFVVQLAERVAREDYETLNASAKQMGGYYSSFRGRGAVAGFQFKDKATAEAFVKLANGDSTEAQQAADTRRDAFTDDRSQSAVERLTEMADKLDERADEAMGRERKANTERRARFAASAEAEARQNKALAKTMRNIAQAIADGKARFLDAVRTKSQVEMLAGLVRTAKDNEIRAKFSEYGEQEKRRGQPPTAETADFSEFPAFTAFRSDLASLARQLLEVDGTKKIGAQLMKVADDVSDAYLKFAKENFHKVSTFSTKTGGVASFGTKDAAERAIARSGYKGKAIAFQVKRGEYTVIMSPSEAMDRGIWTGDGDKRITLSHDFGNELVQAIGRRANKTNRLSVPWQFETAADRLKALARIRIETPAEFRSALREFIGLREQAQEADRVKELERSMIGRVKDGLDFFPTPQDVSDQMVDVAGITPGMSVLEPSAGMGHIADRIREAGAEPDVIEMSPSRRELLEAKGYHFAPVSDFLALHPREFYTFGDVFRAPDGTEGIMHGGRGWSGRASLHEINADGTEGRMTGWYDRSELTGIAHRGTDSGYDRILMNPPFSEGRDIQHVQHAYTLLKPGGRLVALMGESAFTNQNKRASEFRDWLESVGGTEEKLAEGSFQDPSLPVNTGTNARMVVIDKTDQEPAQFKRDDLGRFAPDQGISHSQFTRAISEAFGPKVAERLESAGVVVPLEDQSSLPAHVVPFVRSGDIVYGFYDPKTDRTYAVLQNLSPDMVRGLVMHEVGVHYGFESMLGKPKYIQVINRLKVMGRMGNAEVKSALAQAQKNSVNAAQVPEETLAYMVQNHPEMGVVREVIAAVKAFLFRNFGILGNSLTVDDITALAKAAVQHASRTQPGARRPDFARGTTEVMASRKDVEQTQGEAFKKWFGASKVVDEQGKPLVVYHGTREDFKEFSASSNGEMGRGIYFASKPDRAELYAYKGDSSGPVIPVYVSLQNPASDADVASIREDVAYQRMQGDEQRGAEVQRRLVAEGFDGIIRRAGAGGTIDEVVAFSPNQIKSAIGNNGNFDPNDNRVQFSRAGAMPAFGTLTPDQEQALQNVGGIQPKQTVADRWNALRANLGLKVTQGLFDQFAPIKTLDAKAYLLARMSKASEGTMEAALLYGKPFLRDGVADVDATQGGFAKVLATLKGEQDRFLWWVAAQRAERLKAEGRENLFTDADISGLKTLNAGTFADGTGRAGAYANALRELNAYNDAALKLALESGLIDNDAYEAMRYDPYVPFYRVMEEDGELPKFRGGSGLANQQAFKKLKGGTDKLNNDLLQNLLLNWSHLYSASAKNRAAQATMEAAVSMAVAYPVPGGAPAAKGSIKVMQDGKAVHYQVEDPYLLEAISSLNYVPSPLIKPLSALKHVLTLGVTANPAFKIRNLMRDSIAAIAQADLGYNPMKNVADGWAATSRKSQTYASMLASGGLMKFGTQEDTSRARRQIEKLGGQLLDKQGWEKLTHQMANVWEAYQEFGDRGENVNRAALYEKLVAQGKSHAEASFMARDLMDFSMTGQWGAVRFLAQTVPFLNARLVGLNRLGRAAVDDPKRFAIVTSSVMLASVGLMLAYRGDDDWKRREDFDRDSYYWFKIGDTAFRIPKPFEIGAMGTMAERTAELMIDDEMTGKRFGQRVSNMLFQTFNFDPTPQAFKPLLDVYANKDSFTGRPIEGMADERIRPQDRIGPRTSEVARLLGQMGLPDPAQLAKGQYSPLSPKQMDFLMRGYFGWFGTVMQTVPDYSLRPMMDRGERPAMQLRDVFLAGNFVESLPTGSSRYVSTLYEQAKEIEQAYASYQAALKAGDREQAAQIMESEGPKIRQFHQIERVKRGESFINSQIRRVEASKDLSGQQKRDRIEQLEARRERIARPMTGVQ